MYNYEAELVLRSYLPKKLEKGMLFANVGEHGTMLFELESIPGDKDKFLTEHGAPMEVYIIDEYGDVLAEPNEIGWFDEGENTDELREITLNDINTIINEFDGWLEVEIYEDFYEDDGSLIPNYVEQKIIIKYLTEEEEEE